MSSMRPPRQNAPRPCHETAPPWQLVCRRSGLPDVLAGSVISEKDRCPQCRGNRVVQEKKILEVHVDQGMQHNQKIVFQGEADEAVRSRSLALHLAHLIRGNCGAISAAAMP